MLAGAVITLFVIVAFLVLGFLGAASLASLFSFLEWVTSGKLKFSDRSYGEAIYDPHRHC